MFVPAKLQVAFMSFIAIFWNTYMSYMKNHKVDHGKVLQPTIDSDVDIINDETLKVNATTTSI